LSKKTDSFLFRALHSVALSLNSHLYVIVASLAIDVGSNYKLLLDENQGLNFAASSVE